MMKLTSKAGRRAVAAAAFASAAILLPAVALASSAGTAAPKTSAAPKTAAAAATSTCARSQLTSWLGIPGGATAGSTYYQLEISNISGSSCTLYGYPGVSAIRSGHQLGSAAGRSASHPSTLLTLVPGSTVHVILQIADVYNFPRAACHPRQASALRVYAPGDFSSMQFPFSFTGCSKKGPVYLHVSAAIGSTGIPNYSN